jgi:hypothetical protein
MEVRLNLERPPEAQLRTAKRLRLAFDKVTLSSDSVPKLDNSLLDSPASLHSRPAHRTDTDPDPSTTPSHRTCKWIAGEIAQCTQMRDEEWVVLYVTSIALPFHSNNFLLIHSP